MAEFTPEQESFLRHQPERPGRLIAGPGAGKSFTCVAYMETHSDPERGLPARIKMLTFTRAAAAEFAQTMEHQGLGEGIAPPSTIHSFALSILIRSGYTAIPQPVRIASEWEARELIRPQLSRLLRARGHEQATPGVVERLEREMAAGFESLDPGRILLADLQPALRDAYQGLWQQHRSRLGYVLLSELPYRAGLAVEDFGLPKLDLDLLLVDEYQDLNRADIKLIKLVFDAGLPVVAIGDEDQSIYGWRHAAPQGIRDFPAQFGVEDEDDYRFSINRRCGANILRAAQTLIQQAPDRLAQPAMTPLDPAKQGEVAYLRFPSMTQEAAGVATIVAARLAAGVKPSQIAILARTRIDAWVAALRGPIEQLGIPIASADWVDEALADKGLIRLRAVARLSRDIDDSLAWMTLIELEPGLGNTMHDALYHAVIEGERLAAAVRRAANDGLEGLRPQSHARLRALVERTSAELEHFAVEDDAVIEDWGAWLEERASTPLSPNASRLLRVVGAALTTENLDGFLSQLEPTGHDLALSEQDAVRFMTIQGSKGLTVDTAIVVGVESGYVPLPQGDPNEERRLLYVAMTRATDLCVLTFSQRRIGTLARGGTENLGPRMRSPLLEGVIAPQDARPWLEGYGWG